MADNNDFELETLRISELPQVDTVDKETDVLVVSRKSTANVDDYRSYKVTPEKLLSDVGVTYTAGTNITISQNNEISASYPVVTTSTDGLMLATDKSKLDGIPADANHYELPTATTTEKGGVIVGNNITVDANGVISAQTGPTYTAGTNVQISDQNVISATDTTYSVATQSDPGLMSANDKTKLDGIATGANNYVLPEATASVLGGVMQGTNVTITGGVISATDTTYTDATQSTAGLMSATDKTKLDGIDNNANNYSLPVATASDLGGVKIGSGVTVAADGTISVSGGGGGGASALTDLSDVSLNSPQDGQALIYDSANSVWVNGNGGSGASSLTGLTDVTISGTPTNGQVLTYDTNSSQWVNDDIPTPAAPALGGLSDVTISSASNGQVLKYSNGDWVNDNEAVPTLDNLTNVSISSLANNQILKYDSANQVWKNANETTPTTPSLDDLTNVTITSATADQVLKYDGSDWVNASVPAGATDLDDLTDVDITTPSEGDTLVYDSTNSKWVNGAGGGGGSAKQTTVTQAQYDALVQAGTVDPTMEYFITDGIPASVEYYHNYSTTEHIVGKWIDGSIIYEKTYTNDFVQGSTYVDIDISNENIDTIFGCEGLLKASPEESIQQMVAIPYGATNLVYINIISTHDGYVRITRQQGHFYGYTPTVWITIRYSKSST